MGRFLVFVLLCAAIVVGLGFYLDWFNLRTTRSPDDRQTEIAVSVDRGRVKEDIAAAREKATRLTEGARDYFKRHKVEGTVMSIDTTQGTLTLKPMDNTESVVVRVDKDTTIRRAGPGDAAAKQESLASLQAGDTAVLEYEARTDHKRATSITIQTSAAANASKR